MAEKLNICLDIGGTFIKGMVFDELRTEKIEGISYYPSKSDESKNKIIENFYLIIKDLLSQIPDEYILSSITMAFPGPFDYERGICLIQGLNKYNSLYKVNVGSEIKERLNQDSKFKDSDIPIHFYNDAVAFAYEEFCSNQPKNYKGAYFTLGTGCGSTFIDRGEFVKNEYGIPESGMIYNERFNNSVIDDYISARGLEDIISEKYGYRVNIEKIASKAETGNKDATDIFFQFGENIGLALRPFLENFSPSAVIFGGQISKSFKFMEEGFNKGVGDLKIDHIGVSKDTSYSTIRGLMRLSKKQVINSSEV
ncbi:ROK family protein [Enterococcus sp. S86.2]|uniref:ROK family protein n=1 Tax=Enterococcus sp. S86.2 TaxID=3031299 RepID=UPI0026F1370B|nr:ROK family protein [Enterococcus sp. S86.2]